MTQTYFECSECHMIDAEEYFDLDVETYSHEAGTYEVPVLHCADCGATELHEVDPPAECPSCSEITLYMDAGHCSKCPHEVNTIKSDSLNAALVDITRSQKL